ncbi:MAG: 4-alpha-glucanotransferase, partial [Acidobacteriaceae bacterium]|nr:4-alpha-glucanotransferase [Acidobacteriaceae bacterium]
MRQSEVRTDALGIDHRFKDAHGEWHDVADDTIEAITKAMGSPSPEADGAVIVVRRGESAEIEDAEAELLLESGESVRVRGSLPPDVAEGYHRLRYADGRTVTLIVAPRKCWLPDDLRIWGWALQLYALRSRESWGMGDLEDLRQFADWSARELGAGVIMVNPLHTSTPGLPQNPSPYFPSSRRFRNPLYLRIEDVPGAESLGEDLERLQSAARILNHERIIDRDGIYRLKMDALETLWGRFESDPGCDEYCQSEGLDLERFAAFCVLCEQYGRGWRNWPDECRHPQGAGVDKVVDESRHRVRFYMWLQWLLDRQLARASEPLAMMQDLPIGVDPDGADAWLWQDFLAPGVAVGAPPDLFNTGGQNWGLPPFIPHRLRAAAYDPFIRTIRASMRHAGGLRIDHVMGLFRLFWIPQAAEAKHGAYIRYNADELLAIVALESQRARAFVIGEDLGTVEDGVREKLSENGVLSYRLMWFEEDPPCKFPADALAAVSTHDLPTVAGVWTGSDLEAQKAIGLKPNEEGQNEWREKLGKEVEGGESATTEQVIEQAYISLASAPSRIVTASLDDALAVEERPNMPATLNDKWPNWSLALPVDAEAIRSHALVGRIADIL